MVSYLPNVNRLAIRPHDLLFETGDGDTFDSRLAFISKNILFMKMAVQFFALNLASFHLYKTLHRHVPFHWQ